MKNLIESLETAATVFGGSAEEFPGIGAMLISEPNEQSEDAQAFAPINSDWDMEQAKIRFGITCSEPIFQKIMDIAGSPPEDEIIPRWTKTVFRLIPHKIESLDWGQGAGRIETIHDLFRASQTACYAIIDKLRAQ